MYGFHTCCIVKGTYCKEIKLNRGWKKDYVTKAINFVINIELIVH